MGGADGQAQRETSRPRAKDPGTRVLAATGFVPAKRIETDRAEPSILYARFYRYFHYMDGLWAGKPAEEDRVPSKRGQNRHWCGRVAVLAVLTLAVLGMTVLVAACSRTELTTTTTTDRQFGQNLQRIKINELSNGKIVTVSPGFVIELELKGQPSLRYHWDVLPPDPKIVLALPGPRVLFDQANLQGTFTFTALARSVGETAFTADYVDRQGRVERTFTCTFQVVSNIPTTTTVSEGTTTTASSTTTTAPATTTTAAPTTTTLQPRPRRRLQPRQRPRRPQPPPRRRNRRLRPRSPPRPPRRSRPRPRSPCRPPRPPRSSRGRRTRRSRAIPTLMSGTTGTWSTPQPAAR